MTLRTPRTVGKGEPLAIAILGIGVDQQRFETAPLCGQRLEATVAVRIRVAHDRDLAVQIDTLGFEPVVVRGIAARGIDQLARHIPRGGHAEVGEPGSDAALGILGVAVFLQRRLEPGRREHGDGHLLGPGEEHVVAVQPHVLDPEPAPPLGHPERELVVALGAGRVRLCGQLLEVGGGRVAAQQGVQPLFELQLLLGGGRAESPDRFRRITLRPEPGGEEEERRGGRAAGSVAVTAESRSAHRDEGSA